MKHIPPVLYLLRTKDRPYWAKIGVSKHPWKRAEQESNRIGRDVIISFLWLPKNREDASNYESLVRKKLAHKACVGKEWFSCGVDHVTPIIYQKMFPWLSAKPRKNGRAK